MEDNENISKMLKMYDELSDRAKVRFEINMARKAEQRTLDLMNARVEFAAELAKANPDMSADWIKKNILLIKE